MKFNVITLANIEVFAWPTNGPMVENAITWGGIVGKTYTIPSDWMFLIQYSFVEWKDTVLST